MRHYSLMSELRGKAGREHTPIVWDIQITNVNPEPQMERNDKKTVCFEDDGRLVPICHHSLEEIPQLEPDGAGRILNLPPPRSLEYHPTEPELMRDG